MQQTTIYISIITGNATFTVQTQGPLKEKRELRHWQGDCKTGKYTMNDIEQGLSKLVSHIGCNNTHVQLKLTFFTCLSLSSRSLDVFLLPCAVNIASTEIIKTADLILTKLAVINLLWHSNNVYARPHKDLLI